MPVHSNLSSWVAFAVFGLFVIAFLRKFFRIASLLKNTPATLYGTDPSQRTVHFNTPFGSLDLQKSQSSDPDLESIPRYPGNMPLGEKSGYEMQIRLLGRDGSFLEQQSWTVDPSDIVAAYYQREFPQWQKDQNFAAAASGAVRLQERASGCIRSIEIYSDVFSLREVKKKFPEACTIIKYSVVHGKGAAGGNRF